ncbi:hypothetical protein [Mycoplasma sp. 3341]|uniref:hypothetical protein n=1 Tax=Mycoplasma sp. 3341 TaxID=3447506 RepID=UPI003F65929A
MYFQSITTSNFANYQVSKEVSDAIDYAKKKNNHFFSSKQNLIASLKYLSHLLPYDLINIWLLEKYQSKGLVHDDFEGWKKRGYYVKKGQKASYIVMLKNVSFLIDKENNDVSLVEFKRANSDQIKKYQNGELFLLKKKMYTLVPVFDENQLNKPFENKTKNVNFDTFKKIIIQIAKELNCYAEFDFSDNQKFKQQFYNVLKLVFDLNNSNKSIASYNLNLEMIAYLLLEHFNLNDVNDWSYDFEFLQWYDKNLDETEKEKLIITVHNIALFFA